MSAICSHLDAITLTELPETISGREDAPGSGHPIVRSVEPGEDWRWCYIDHAMFVVSRR
jgi:hypothetical protein